MWFHSLIRAVCLLGLCLVAPIVGAQPFTDSHNSFLSRSDTINHPNCLTNPLPAPTGTVLNFQAPFPRFGQEFLTVSVGLQVWRVRCPDNSTEILMRFVNTGGNTGLIPTWSGLVVVTPDQRVVLANLYEIPNGEGSAPGQIGVLRQWNLLEENASQTMVLKLDPFLPLLDPFTRTDLQGALQIGFYLGELSDTDSNPATPLAYDLTAFAAFDMPASSAMNSSPQFTVPPLTGRHAGSWVVEDTADQGIVLSINELPDRRLVATMGWFTYDASGQQVWYTGSAFFNPGDNGINFNLTTIDNGHFQSNQSGTRRILGPASIRVESCEGLIFTYDLRSMGLDNRTVVLRRLFEGEIAGYPCRANSDRS